MVPNSVQAGSDVVLTKFFRIYRVQWTRNGFCYIISVVNHSIVGVYSADEGKWVDDAALPEDIRDAAMQIRPDTAVAPWNGLNGANVIAHEDGSGTTYVRLPVQLQRPIEATGNVRCSCQFCQAHPNLMPSWDTLAIPKSGTAWVVHMPDPKSFRDTLAFRHVKF